jgi:hypothetical protein
MKGNGSVVRISEHIVPFIVMGSCWHREVDVARDRGFWLPNRPGKDDTHVSKL